MQKYIENNSKLGLTEEYKAFLTDRFVYQTEEEIEQTAKDIFDFLSKVHIELVLRKNLRVIDGLCIEIRALKRDGLNPFYDSIRIFNFREKERLRFYNFLKKLNEKRTPYCLYWSVFNFDSNTLAISTSGKESKSWNNKIALNNACCTSTLVADFDDITEEEFNKYREIIEKELDLKPLIIFSGHGYQMFFLLKNVCYDKLILTKFNNLLRSKGFKIDPKIKDCARIMRSPHTHNCKDICKDNLELEYRQAIKTYYVQSEAIYYNLDDILEKFESLDTVIPISELEKKEIKKTKTKKTDKKVKEEVSKEQEAPKKILEKKENNLVKNLNKNTLSDEKLKELYDKYLNISNLDKSIKLMLSGFQERYANNVLMFLVLYFRDRGHSKSSIIAIISILKDLDTFNYSWNYLNVKDEVDRFYYSNYKRSALQKELVEFGFVEYDFEVKDTVIIYNHIFKNLSNISNKSFILYLRLLEIATFENRYEFTKKEISEIMNISKKRIKHTIDELIKVKYIDKKRSYKKGKEEYKYYLSYYKSQNSEFGYTKINRNLLVMLLDKIKLKELNETQITICMYLKYVCFNNKNNCCIAQETIAKSIGVTQSLISQSFNKIEKTRLLKRTEEEINDFKFKYKYTIYF